MGTQITDVPFRVSHGLSPSLAGRFNMSTPLMKDEMVKQEREINTKHDRNDTIASAKPNETVITIAVLLPGF